MKPRDKSTTRETPVVPTGMHERQTLAPDEPMVSDDDPKPLQPPPRGSMSIPAAPAVPSFDPERFPYIAQAVEPSVPGEANDELETPSERLARILTATEPTPVPPSRRTPTPESHGMLSFANSQAASAPPAEISRAIVAARKGPVEPRFSVPAQKAKWGDDPLTEMRERFSLGDYTGALSVAEAVLEQRPSDVEASACADSCRAVLIKMYMARLGPFDKVPTVIVAPTQLRWLSIDHRAGFILSHIDGSSSLEMILDVSGMPPLDCLRILYELVQQRVVAFK